MLTESLKLENPVPKTTCALLRTQRVQLTYPMCPSCPSSPDPDPKQVIQNHLEIINHVGCNTTKQPTESGDDISMPKPDPNCRNPKCDSKSMPKLG